MSDAIAMYTHGPSSAFESETFGEDLSFHIEQPVGSMSISPCGRDVVLASLVSMLQSMVSIAHVNIERRVYM